ncbi:hypothetical protein EWX76_08825 [Enterococcus faecium]|nr:hypothetical protein [Enterococcus faecium]
MVTLFYRRDFLFSIYTKYFTLSIGYVTLLLYTNLTLSIITFLLIPLQIWWISKSSSKIKK